MSDAFSRTEITKRLHDLVGWQFDGKQIAREFKLEDFKQAVRFVNRIALTAEQLNHHPDILIQYNKVTVSVFTHSANGITQKDLDLAFKINGLVD